MASSSSSAPSSVIKGNRLAREKSPYLLQHAANPVDWYPWGEEAIQKAKRENKPIFLSVGYSTCHWCHVMERESFENEYIGRLLNESFVSIKVDREERPDVDKVYMTFIQATEGGGGWPMSVFLTPELKPFFGGTYFPPSDTFGRPGFATVLKSLSKQWQENKDKLSLQGSHVMDILKEGLASSQVIAKDLPDPMCVEKACSTLVSKFDKEYGGFGSAPKFPQPSILNCLLHFHLHNKGNPLSDEAVQAAFHTLRAMARGGMHDHVGQGFHRYSTDKFWHVPHFEKMLYDQGQLATSYAVAYQISGDAFYKEIVDDILLYVSRDLCDKDGGFYSAEDADSYPKIGDAHKKEGAFCVWEERDLRRLLVEEVPGNPGVSNADVFAHHFDVKPKGNVNPSQDPHGELTGQNVLIVRGSIEQTAKKFSLSLDEVKAILQKAQKILLEERAKRPKPHRDDKILTGWNGLMISGCAVAARVLGNKDYTKMAENSARFVLSKLYNPDKQILMRNAYRDADGVLSVGTVEGFADDYAFFVGGLLDLFDVTQDPYWIEVADRLTKKQIDLFWDDKNGGFFSSSGTDSSVLLRMKEDQDGAEPSPNSVSARNLLRLGILLDSENYRSKAKMTFMACKEMLDKYPMALTQMLIAYLDFLHPPPEVVLCGDRKAPEMESMIACVNKSRLPSCALIVHDGSDSCFVQALDAIKAMKPIDGKVTAYVCKNYACSNPVTTVEELEETLHALN